ncbi:hypothetical protein HDV05_005024 [Chytridiales sp. JEL 0842]|nr:hypothetical protein HDV05_005024 [Chytridiales sp. JEL 0842]
MTTTTTTMKAIQYTQPGGPDVITYTDVPKPTAGPGQLLVRNHFVGVNFIDTYHRSGLYKVPMPYTPGREAAGIVEAVGDGVTGFKIGDRVAYMAPNCYAEYNVAPALSTVVLPDNIPLEEGAALLLQGATAMSLLKYVYEVKRGDYVLVHAAAGGTGRLLVQLAKHFGAFVIGTTSTPEKAKTAKAAGADEVILYTTQSVSEEVARITSGKGVHVVYDGVGKSTFDVSLSCLRRLGTLASFGNASGKVADVDIMKLVPRAVRLMRPSLFELLKTEEDYEVLVKPLLKLLSEKAFSIHIHKIYDLKDAAQAQVDLEGRGTQGKLVLKV